MKSGEINLEWLNLIEIPTDEEILKSIIEQTEIKLSISIASRNSSVLVTVVDFGEENGELWFKFKTTVNITVQIFFPSSKKYVYESGNVIEATAHYSRKTGQGNIAVE